MKYVVFKTNKGDITLEVNDESTPITATDFLKYVEDGFYNTTIFHRVVKDFVIQTGGYDQTLVQKPFRQSIYNEAAKGGQHLRGTVGIALDDDPHSGGCEIFINVKDNPRLNHISEEKGKWGYCVFARVIDGMDVVDQISNMTTAERKAPNKQDHEQDEFANVPADPVTIEHAEITLAFAPRQGRRNSLR